MRPHSPHDSATRTATRREIVRLERNGVSDFRYIMFRREWRVDVRPLWTPAVFTFRRGGSSRRLH